MNRTFDTPDPIELYVEIGAGRITTEATDTTRTEVTVTGKHADDVTIEQSGRTISVVAPRQRTSFFSRDDAKIDVHVTLPTGSDLVTQTGSADVVATGTWAETHTKSGSGDVRVEAVTGDAVHNSGSGDLHLEEAGGDVRVKSGSGDITIERATGSVAVSTGSGDVTLGSTGAETVTKSGSGDLTVREAAGELTSTTASGDLVVATLQRGSVNARTASGDVAVGIPAGVPVWTDIHTLSGSLRSDLDGAGQPQAGQEYLEVRAQTASGSVTLKQL